MFVGIVVLGAGLAWLAVTYQGLARHRQELYRAWAEIENELARRHELIQRLLQAVRGYFAHERQTLDKVVAARTQAANAQGMNDQLHAENQLTRALRSLLTLIERYPDLKAHPQVATVYEELTATETRLAAAQQAYNEQIVRFNTAIERVPANTIAPIGGFTPAPRFDLHDLSPRPQPASH